MKGNCLKVAFGYANTISTVEKLYVVLGTIIVGIIGYTICEIIHARKYKIHDEKNEQKSKGFKKTEIYTQNRLTNTSILSEVLKRNQFVLIGKIIPDNLSV